MRWADLPASYHNGAANLAFADGHLETHKWRCASTKPPPSPDAAHLPFPVPATERADFDVVDGADDDRRLLRTTVPRAV